MEQQIMASKKKTTTRPRLNSERVSKLFKELKSISKVAKRVGASYVGVRLNLIASRTYRPS